MYITILGRQPALGIAELEQLYGSKSVRWFSDISASVDNTTFDFERLGGTQKAGRVVAELHGDWRQVSMKLVSEYVRAWSDHDGKITLGISAFGFKVSARDVQKTGIILKSKLKTRGVSLRLIPNAEPALNTATSHHNKLGLSDNHVELLVVRNASGKVIVAESVGAQNITALAARDQGRPKRDAFVGMLPPKLAQMMINMAVGTIDSSEVISKQSAARESRRDSRREAVSKELMTRPSLTILDPFCGTGVLLQEAALLGYNVYGTDLSDKMVDYTRINLDWIIEKYQLDTDMTVEAGDAMEHRWTGPIDAIACESYLGQPFSAPPSPAKLDEVVKNCEHIIGQSLKNLAAQLSSGTPLCVGVPAWRDATGRFTHLPLTKSLARLGYERVELKTVRDEQLLYYREDQVVARELLLLKKK